MKQINSSGAFTGNLINAINYNTRRAEVSIAVKGDASFKFEYRNCNWSADLGYNVYGQSAEKLHCFKGFADTSIQNNTYAIKGTEGTNYTTYTLTTSVIGAVVSASNPLNSSENNATICAPTTVATVDNALTTLNLVAGTVGLTYNSVTAGTVSTTGVSTGVIVAETSNPPVTLTNTGAELDPKSGLACAQITNKVFGYVGYTWADCDWTPFFGVDGYAEFAAHNSDKTGLSKWGVGVKGGLAF